MKFHIKPNTYVGVVSLKVSDLERSLDYYQNIIGFQILDKTDTTASLTADGKTPLVLLERPENPIPKNERHAGLYHFAILLPSRADLGAFLNHVLNKGVPLGASDHIVSEAIYLNDPDGNGIEVYADRPKSYWQLGDGRIQMATEPLNARSLLAEAKDKWVGLPSGTIMGHIHLHAVNLEKSKQFYCDGLGFDVVYYYPQAVFMSTGGYHHHVAINTWNRAIEEKPQKNQVGLDWFSVVYPSGTAREQAVTNLEKLGYAVTKKDDIFVVEDPSNICIHLTC